MIEQLKIFDNNTLAVEVVNGFTEADEKLGAKLIQNKLNEGYDHVNILIKVDEAELSESDIKALFEESKFLLNNVQHLKRIAVVGDSKWLKSLVPVDRFFFKQMNHSGEEKYFETSQLNEALAFVN